MPLADARINREGSTGLPGWRWLAAAVLVALGILATRDVWSDMFRTALQDEESGHILLVPFVALWLFWVRRRRLNELDGRGQWAGVAVLAFGWLLWSYGYRTAQHTFWDAGAILIAVGAALTFLGKDLLLRFLPAFVVLAFLIPVWPVRRQQLAWPLQVVTARVTQVICETLGMNVERHGNLLMSNGVDVAIAEACNGMRMVLTLLLVSYVYAFINPLRTVMRVIILVISPVTAVVCNVIRLVPTVWVYGHASMATASRFHDISGWVMLGVAFLMLIGIVRFLRWANIPVMKDEVAGAAPRDLARQPFETSARFSWAPVLSLALLGGVALEQRTFRPPPNVDSYHARVREVAAQIPLRIGQWMGEDVPVPYDVLDRLRPNVLISRRYQNLNDGRQVGFLVVQCKDARLLAGHYPPTCYRNEGYVELTAEAHDWMASGLRIPGMQYEFGHDAGGSASMVIANFIVMPDGQILRDIDAVNAAAADMYARFYGAAEFQIVCDPESPQDARDETVNTFATAVEPLIRVLATSGAPKVVPPRRWYFPWLR